MKVTIRDAQPWEQWRPGVKTRIWTGALYGAYGMCMGEQLFDPGTEAPRHWHYFEEQLTVWSGLAEFFVDGEIQVLGEGATVTIAPLLHHGFKNVGDGVLHIVGVLASPVHETFFLHDPEGVATRVYEITLGGARRKLIPQLIEAS